MPIKTKLIFNSFHNARMQKILDKETIAEKEHTHQISEINNLSNALTNANIKIGGKIKN